MGYKSLTTRRIAIRNLLHKPFRTACLVIAAAIVAFTLFSGAVLTASLRNGIDRMIQRFGADLMVVPSGYSEKASALLLRGEPQVFYFNQALVQNIAQVDGIKQLSPQFYLTSLEDECCSLPVQLIGFDPQTDFVVQPWIAEVMHDGIKDGEMVVGSEITVQKSGALKFFNHDYPVAAKLRKAASGLDTSIFMTMNTLRDLVDAAHKEGYIFIADREPEGAISSILVRLDKDSNITKVSRLIKDENPGVDVIASSRMFQGITESLTALTAYAKGFSAVLWILAVVVLGAVFSGSINERKKEFAVIRVLGATREKLAAIVLQEAALTGLTGGLIGTALAALVVFPFSTFISLRLQLPYIQPRGLELLWITVVSLVLSFIVGPLASIYSAVKISRAETYYTMREGE
ncbi:ABC transporter permease [Treponema primitia]|uniref:ABC transporter permease n=1 Tax=Treponema primitia TaxID=88058 RepID=UPI00025553CC|nr:ABC transporter permease [Treponema primitia]